MKKVKSKIAILICAILIWSTVVPGLGKGVVFAETTPTPNYDENGDFDYDPILGNATQVDPDFSVDAKDGEQFAEGNIRFEIADEYVETDRLFIPEGSEVVLSDGSVLTFSNGEFLLDGVTIASVNNDDNGEGKALQIDLSAPLPNGNFEEGATGEGVTIPSWTINNQSKGPTGTTINQIWLGDLASKTQNRKYDSVVSNGDGTYTVTGPNNEYTYQTTVNYNSTASSGDSQAVEGFEAIFTSFNNGGFVKKVYSSTDTSGQALEIGFLNSLLSRGDYSVKDGKIASSFGIEAISEPFNAKAGDRLFFDWKANDGGDDYEVYGFLVNQATGESTEILYGRGSAQDWTTNTGNVPDDGTYKFRFVAGSFNRTDGTTHGATLSIDNVRVVSSRIVQGVVNAIGQMVHYTNTQYSGNRPVNISVTNGEGNASTVKDPDAVIRMSTKEEAKTNLGEALNIVSPENGAFIYDPEQNTITGTIDKDSTFLDATVDVTVSDPNGQPIYSGPATVNQETGEWTIDLDDPLISGDYTITATASKGGVSSEPETSTFTFVDKSELENYYNQVKDLVQTDYQSGWEDDPSDPDLEFGEALQRAKAILDDIANNTDGSNPNQAAIDQALSELQKAKDSLVRISPTEQSSTFEHGYNEITIDFDKDVVFKNPDNATAGFTVTVGEGENARQVTVVSAVADGDKVILTVDEKLDSDVAVTVAYTEEEASSNLIGAEQENAGPVRDFKEDFPATDSFGAALQIEGTTGNTDDSTPSFNGTVDVEADSVKVDITDLDGNVIVSDIPAVIDPLTGTWNVTDSEWEGFNKLTKGDYKVVATATKEGRNPVVKEENFTVVDKTSLQAEYDEVLEFKQDDYRANWEDFARELEEAKGILDNPTASQSEIDRALNELQSARDALEKHPPLFVDATFLHGQNDIIVEFNKNVTFENEALDLTSGFTVTIDGELVNVVGVEKVGLDSEGKTTELKLILAEDVKLSSDAEVKVIYNEEAGNANLVGDEENGTAVQDFEYAAGDAFGHALQIDEPNGITNDTTPAITGTVDTTADSAVITIIGPDGKEIIIEDGLLINEDGTWTYQIEDKIPPGEYTVKVTTSLAGRPDVTKTHTFHVVDKEPLINLVDNITKENLLEDEYTEYSWLQFETSLEKAKNVIADPSMTQDEVDKAYADLEAAYNNLVYKQELKEEEALSKNLVSTHYSKESWNTYEQALKNAQEVLNNPAATQDEVDTAKEELQTAREALTVDKTALEEEVNKSSELNSAHYSKESWEKYQEVLKEAEAVLTNPAATQDKIDTAKEELEAAREALTVDKTALEEEVEKSTELNSSHYSKESWSEYEKALTNAQEVLNDPAATQDIIDTAKEELETAREALTVDKTALEEEVEKSSKLNGSHYLQDSWNAFEKVLKDAQEILDDPAATQDKVNNALDELQAARDALEKHPPIVENATFLHGQNEIILEFNKDVTFENGEADLTSGFTVTVDGQPVKVIGVERIGLDSEGKTNELKLILANDVQLLSDAEVKVTYSEESGISNLVGDEENGSAVLDFEFEARDAFGHALQIDDPNGITNDTTPAIKGTVDPTADSAVITIIGPDGKEIVIEDGLLINEDGTWIYQIENKLVPGEYTVEVTTSQKGRSDVTKKHTFIVVDKEPIHDLVGSIISKDLQEDEYTENSWSNLEVALEKAKNVLTNPEATQEEVDQAFTELESAYQNLVYKQTLKEEVALSNDLVPTDYSKESWNNYEQALKKAQEVLNNPAATQEEVDLANAKLEEARKGLTVDKTALTDEVNKSSQLSSADYSKESWENYEKALKEAEAVLKNSKATQSEVDAVEEALTKAREALTVNKEPLEKEVSKSDQLKASDYTETSWKAYEEALEYAKKVLADANATQAIIDEVLSTLKDAREALTVNKAPLEEEVSKSDQLKASDYTKESWKKYEEALEHAKKVLADPNATQSEVEEALASLVKAREALTVNKELLEEEVSKSNKLKPSDYTEASWKKYAEALEHAKKVLADPHATQSEVDEALDTLKEARKALDGKGFMLPKTATNTFTYLMVGLVLLLVGFALITMQKRRRKVS